MADYIDLPILTASTGASGGTVTSVALALPNDVFTVTGSPVTMSGTLMGVFADQDPNTVFAGPEDGGPGAPTFRALVAADLPGMSGSSGVLSVAATPPIYATTGANPVISITMASATVDGYLSSGNFNVFNAKQPAGNYITALTGDATASGPGSAALTLSTVNASSGTFGSASSAVSITVNGKGLTTASSQTPILISESQVINLVNDLAAKQSSGNYLTAITGDLSATGPGSAQGILATVNSTSGTFGSTATIGRFTVNGKGLVTSTTAVTLNFQTPGNYLTALTGDATASGPGSAALTLSTVNSSSGSFGSASSAVVITVNGKGLTTASSQTPIVIAESQVINLVNDLAAKQSTGNYLTGLTGDVSASGPGNATATLATVHPAPGTYGTSAIIPVFTVNAKGLVTSTTGVAIAASGGGITELTGDVTAGPGSGAQAATVQQIGVYPTSSVVLATSAVLYATSAGISDTIVRRAIDSSSGNRSFFEVDLLKSSSGIGVSRDAIDLRGRKLVNSSASMFERTALNWGNYELYYATGRRLANWGNGTFYDTSGTTASIATGTRNLIALGGTNSVSWGTRNLVDSGGIVQCLDWGVRLLRDTEETRSMDWGSRVLFSSLATSALNWERREGFADDGTQSIRWGERTLKYGNAEQEKVLNWDRSGVWISNLSSSGTAVPTVSLSQTSGLGVGAVVNSTGWGNVAGLMSLRTGTTPLANTTGAIVNLVSPLSSPTPTKIFLTPANAIAAGAGPRNIYGVGSTGPRFTVMTGTSALLANTLYLWNWMVIGG